MKKIVASYDYRDEQGCLLYQVVRYEPKEFRQRRPDGAGDWTWDLQGIERVPYRLPELLSGILLGKPVYIVEGEKDADALVRLGLNATTNSGGAAKWQSSFAHYFARAHVAIIPDNDGPGWDHACKIAKSLIGTAKSVRLVMLPGLPPKGDVSCWLAKGGTSEDLAKFARDGVKVERAGSSLNNMATRFDVLAAIARSGLFTAVQVHELFQKARGAK